MNKAFPSFRKLRKPKHQVNTQSQRRPFLQSDKGPLNPQSYLTHESYLQVREPRRITSGRRAAQISEPRLMVSAIIWKPVKNYGSEKKIQSWMLRPVAQVTFQRHPTIYELNLLILMTIYDMKCSSKILIQIKSEVGKPEVLCYQLAGNSLRPANFSQPSVVQMLLVW